MSYLERLSRSARASGNLLCLGLDPVPERVAAVEGPDAAAAGRFLERILTALEQEGCLPSILKPNLAYFEQFGSAGLKVLEGLLERWRGRCLMLLDAKRGDIGPSSAAYARALFDHWGADAVTVSPWMGRDSLEPFLERCGRQGVYVLLRTSNPGAADLQLRQSAWRALGELLRGDWYRPGLGAVMGATGPEELSAFAAELGELPFPLLIPGVGTQGGEADVVLRSLAGTRLELHRVNVSSGVLYAFEKAPGQDYAATAVAAACRYAEALTLPQLEQKR